MKTHHKIVFKSAEMMSELEDESVDLIVTSPPYPMIEMWDETFIKQNPAIEDNLRSNDGNHAFELMHKQLELVWDEIYRVLKNGGIACINIGDATRTIDREFKLYSNHSAIMSYFLKSGFSNLPNIIWRKQTNAPNKFMGSGMLPPGAYVTLEHEYILIFRKGTMRKFATENEKILRKQSAFFWEERNSWFSDVWDMKGTPQRMTDSSGRARSGAFPFEVPYRLINMFSLKGDTVLDPFIGTGSTMLASIASCRNSIGYELDETLQNSISSKINGSSVDYLNEYIYDRLNKHRAFVEDKIGNKGAGAFKHTNEHFGFYVTSSQETGIVINHIQAIRTLANCEYEATYFVQSEDYKKTTLF